MIEILQSSKFRLARGEYGVKRRWWQKYGLELATIPAGMMLMVALWALVAWLVDYPTFILPDPLTVFAKIGQIAVNGLLWHHVQATLIEIIGGLALGLTLATVLGYLLAKSPLLERLVGPYIVASQSIPSIAIAPLLIIWFGSGKLSKVLICTLVVFFPVL
ncbi:MAG: ABC transporter permease subunit, partial [Chloroflexota bacterium]